MASLDIRIDAFTLTTTVCGKDLKNNNFLKDAKSPVDFLILVVHWNLADKLDGEGVSEQKNSTFEWSLDTKVFMIIEMVKRKVVEAETRDRI